MRVQRAFLLAGVVLALLTLFSLLLSLWRITGLTVRLLYLQHAHECMIHEATCLKKEAISKVKELVAQGTGQQFPVVATYDLRPQCRLTIESLSPTQHSCTVCKHDPGGFTLSWTMRGNGTSVLNEHFCFKQW